MPPIESLLAEVGSRWRQRGLTLGPSASPSALRDFESRFRVQCPDDFSTYLLTIGGMPEGTWDEHLIRFWPLAEIRPTTPIEDRPSCFVFEDWSILAHEYAIRLSTPARSRVALIGGSKPRPIAPDFATFLTLYLTHPASLFI
jgi:hypothetical protein